MRRLSLLLLAAAVFAQEGESRLEWTSGRRSRYVSVRRFLEGTMPDGSVVPEDVQQPWLGSWPFAGGRLTLLVDGGTKRVWIDTDGDGSLVGEQPRNFRRRHGTHLLTVEHRGVPLLVERRGSDPPRAVRVTVLAHRAGHVVLEGRARRVEADDLDADARPDLLRVDADGDLRLEDAESLESGKRFRIRGNAYRAVVLDHGGRVRFERADSAPPRPPERWPGTPVPGAGRDAPGTELDVKRAWEDARDRSPFVAESTLRRIGATGTRRAGRLLWSVFRRERSDRLRKAALEALGYREFASMGQRVGSVARTNRDAGLREVALDTLHRMEAPKRLRTLRRVLEREEEPALARKAAFYLAAMGDEGRAELREATLRLSHRPNRALAYRFATRTSREPPDKEFVLEVARARDPDLRAAGLRDARRLAYPEAHALALEAAASPKMTPALRLAVVEDLAAWGDAASVRAVLPLAEGAQPAAQGRLIDLLRAVRDRAAATVLMEELAAGGPETRALCATVLARLPVDADAVLVARLRAERHELVLRELMRACARRRCPGASFAIVEAARARDRRQDVQEVALAALGRLGLDEPVAFDYVRERAATKDWKERITVLDAIADTGDPRGAPVLAGTLDDPKWQVRLAAVQGLARLRARTSIGPLIERLEQEEHKRLRRAITDALHRITHKRIFDAGGWRRWWRAHDNGFEVPEEPPGASADAARRTVAFYGIPVDSERIVFVIDQSGSMSASIASTGRRSYANRLEKAKAETRKVVAKLDDRARVNVVFFESVIHEWKNGVLTPLYGSTRRNLAEHLAEREPEGGTDLFGGLERGLETRDVDTIYLLSDGAPSAGLTDPDDILEQVRKLNRTRRITVHCVSVGRDAPLLRRIAEATGGKYVRR